MSIGSGKHSAEPAISAEGFARRILQIRKSLLVLSKLGLKICPCSIVLLKSVHAVAFGIEQSLLDGIFLATFFSIGAFECISFARFMRPGNAGFTIVVGRSDLALQAA